ncbi:polysaccharide deacetylase family protein [Streptomyces sp. NPDC056347]|uniref:polysaccharide deacetylase family protein n=1 Tax=Streptomyces sp. NPDC056347 TaxID=3345790 RepID=UPI0035E31730
MQLVRQNEKSTAKPPRPATSGERRRRGRSPRRPAVAVLAALLLAAVGSGCASEPGGRPPGEAGQRERALAGNPGPPPGAAGLPVAPGLRRGLARLPGERYENARLTPAVRARIARKWGLDRPPLIAPLPPVAKPRVTTRAGFEVEGDDGALPPVFTTVPTKDRVVFLTIDDGAEKDPELLQMMDELDIPYSAFLSDDEVKDNYGYFGEAQRLGTVLANHTLHHPYLPGLSYDEQRHEICGQQDAVEARFGKRPRLFRPPYGSYDADTLRAARSCGIEAVPLWSAEAFPDRMEWREGDRDLHPGDIVLTHFRGRAAWGGSMTDLVRAVMRTVTERGYAVARLEDYV